MTASEESPALPDAARIVLRRRIEWIDTDAAGIYHHHTVLRLAEAAEAAMHTRLGVAHLTFGRTPRLRVLAEFRRPVRFNDLVEVDLAVGSIGRSSLTYRFKLAHDGELAAEGEMLICHIDPSSGRAVPWPAEVRAALAGGGVQPGVDG